MHPTAAWYWDDLVGADRPDRRPDRPKLAQRRGTSVADPRTPGARRPRPSRTATSRTREPDGPRRHQATRRVDRVGLPLDVRGHGAVGLVAHPAGHAEPLGLPAAWRRG